MFRMRIESSSSSGSDRRKPSKYKNVNAIGKHTSELSFHWTGFVWLSFPFINFFNFYPHHHRRCLHDLYSIGEIVFMRHRRLRGCSTVPCLASTFFYFLCRPMWYLQFSSLFFQCSYLLCECLLCLLEYLCLLWYSDFEVRFIEVE